MSTLSNATESVVRTHLQCFLEQRGIDAIVRDYDDAAVLVCEDRAHRGRAEIREFFAGFVASLPPGTIERFALKCLRVEGELAYITWSAGNVVPLGTDTFVVRGGRIVAQTFAMQPGSAA
jgi:ketosteroid isomerase-like protein